MRGESSAQDLSKQRFGMLTALRPVDKNRNGCYVWLCKCDCGGLALRSVADLNKSQKLGAESACRTCNSEAYRGFLQSQRLARQERLAANLAAGYGLWSPWAEEDLANRIRDATAEQLGFYPREEWPTEAWVDPVYFDQSPDIRMFAGPEERCVNLISEARKDPEPDLSLIEAALKRARTLALSTNDQKRAMQSAIFFARAGGEALWLSFEQLAIRWQCSVKTVEFFVDRGLPTAPQFRDFWGNSIERGVFVPKADCWLAGRSEDG